MAPPPTQVALAQKYGKQFGVDPRLLLAIGGHETQWGAAGAGRATQGGYVLGYGVTDSKTLSQYAGVENQYRYAAKTLASWGVHSIADIQAGKASRYATDPAWENGVMAVYAGLGGKMPSAPGAAPATAGKPSPTETGTATPVDYRKQAALSALGDIVAGKKPTDTLQSTVEAAQRAPSFSEMEQSVQKGANLPLAGSGIGQAVVRTAAQEIGQPYVWGGESEGGFDCSGLVDFAMRKHGYQGPRITTETIKGMGHSVMGQVPQPGDLILANHGEHVVIYAGNGRVISAPHTGARVRYQPITDYKITDIRRPY